MASAHACAHVAEQKKLTQIGLLLLGSHSPDFSRICAEVIQSEATKATIAPFSAPRILESDQAQSSPWLLFKFNYQYGMPPKEAVRRPWNFDSAKLGEIRVRKPIQHCDYWLRKR